MFREVGEGYSIPLGVWQVRENVRNAMKNRFLKFSTQKEALDYIRTRLRIRLEDYLKISKILNRKTLLNFMKTTIISS